MWVIEVREAGIVIGYVGTHRVPEIPASSIDRARKFSLPADAYAWVESRPDLYRAYLWAGYELKVANVEQEAMAPARV